MAIDPAFGVNDFGTPKMYSESETLANNILSDLFGKPGSYPTMPNKGMDITRLTLMMYDEINEEDLKNELISQCSSYKEVVRNGEFDVIKTLLTTNNGVEVPTVLFKIPAKIKNVYRSLIIGVSTSGGQVSYNFTWHND